jgi:hypothetical protein
MTVTDAGKSDLMSRTHANTHTAPNTGCLDRAPGFRPKLKIRIQVVLRSNLGKINGCPEHFRGVVVLPDERLDRTSIRARPPSRSLPNHYSSIAL